MSGEIVSRIKRLAQKVWFVTHGLLLSFVWSRRSSSMLNSKQRPDSAPDSFTSGWHGMFKALRDVDVSKVDDCRDDIDTLLVFAGLYSAVLTAFVIESYKNLQQDSQVVIIGLLQQIASQSFISGPGFLNSTNTSPSLPSFEPPLWAIRVNVLWFTSLLLSLASASLGILVKQWLREYLALEYAAPRERLRARQYRNPALSEWKVFEIAAILPLLLQISLGLFFLGLCFFTSAVHSSIGHATVPVVSAWVFLLLVTTIAPLFSPRCPFRTTFLKGALKVGRRYVFPASRRLFWSTRRYSRKIRRDVSLHYRRFVARTRSFIGHGTSIVLWDLNAASQHEEDPETPQSLAYALLEEEEFVKTEQEDVEIVLSVDSLVSDDGLLPTMLDALQQQVVPNPAGVVSFVTQVVGRRIGRELHSSGLTSILDLQILSKNMWFVITDTVANLLLHHGHGPLQPSSLSWVIDAVVILLSTSRFELSDVATRALHSYVATRTNDLRGTAGIVLGQRLVGGPTLQNLQLSQSFLNLRRMTDVKTCLRSVTNVYKTLLCQDSNHSHHTLHHLLDAHLRAPNFEEFVESSKGILYDLFDFIVAFISWGVTSRKEGADYFGWYEAIHIVLQHGPKVGRPEDSIKLCRLMLLTNYYVFTCMSRFGALNPGVRVTTESDHIYIDTFLTSNEQDQAQILTHSTSKLDSFSNGTFDAAKFVQVDIVRLFQLYLSLYIRVFDSDDSTSALPRLWKGLWVAFTKAIERYYHKSGWKFDKARPNDYWRLNTSDPVSEELLEADTTLVHELIVTIYSYPAILAQQNTQDASQIPPALVEALWLFVLPQERAHLHERFQGLPPLDAPRKSSPDKRTTEEKKTVGGEAKGGEKAKNTGNTKGGKVVQKKAGSSAKGDNV